MRKDQFINKHAGLNIAQSELDRKWRVLQEEMQMQELYEAAMQQSAPQATAMGGGSITPSLFTEIVPNNDFYFTFS
jgi:hypothetical protein